MLQALLSSSRVRACSQQDMCVVCQEPLTLELDFLGKDSMRFYEKIDFNKYKDNGIGEMVYNNLKKFCARKKPTDDVFDTLTPSVLNKHLSSIMPGLTAKVFRTYNASITLQEQLPKHIDHNLTSQQQVKIYNTANREVSILCNHQRSVPKSFGAAFAKLQARADQLAKQVSCLARAVCAPSCSRIGAALRHASVVNMPSGCCVSNFARSDRRIESHGSTRSQRQG